MTKLLTCTVHRLVPVEVIVCLMFAATAVSSSAQTFTSLVSFGVTNGAYPYSSSLTQGRDGNLYGTTSAGGANNGCGHGGCGTFFKLDPNTAQLTILYSFCAQPNCTDGANPQAGVVLGTNGNFYGSTAFGGSQQSCFAGIAGCGTIFEITSAGALTTLHVFSGADGADPQGALIQAANGNFYGTTYIGGQNNEGTVFQMTPAGTLTTIHSFSGSDGSNPQSGVIQATNGNFYGTTQAGGAGFAGTVFQMTGGTLTAIHSFNGFDGILPNGLVQATDGKLYGTAAGGGTSTACNGGSCGTVFQMILQTDTLTTLYSFDDGVDGAQPSAGLIQAMDKNLYGTTAVGGANKSSSCTGNLGCGTVFAITTGGALTTLHSFDYTDGFEPTATLLQATTGIVYGTTNYGGSGGCDCGTIFSLSVPGLGPFVRALTYSGKVGKTIEFLGQNFTKSSTVSFNGTPATPTAIRKTYLTVTVPSGATTGLVTVTTSKGTLTSNEVFHVIP